MDTPDTGRAWMQEPPTRPCPGGNWDEAYIVPSIDAEYRIIAALHGSRNEDWHWEKQQLTHHGKRVFDILHIRLENCERRVYFFDITGFFGKGGSAPEEETPCQPEFPAFCNE